jgi:hypothetical protein
MAKPWSRYQVGFINHPKFRALPGNAILLWIEGKNYADEHLTDGYLPLAIIKGFRFYSKRNAAALQATIGPKDAAGSEHYGPLWEAHAVGVKMHDYLDHNECAEAVRARIGEAEDQRTKSKQRLKAWRERKRAERRGAARPLRVPNETPSETHDETPSETPSTPPMKRNETGLTDTEYRVVPPNPPAGGSLDRRAESVLTDAASTLLAADHIAEHARAFIERYPEIYAKARSGANYCVRVARDFPAFLELVTRWPDMDYLCDMLRLFLLKKDFAPKNEPGSPRQFLWLAPQCDALLREAKRRSA